MGGAPSHDVPPYLYTAAVPQQVKLLPLKISPAKTAVPPKTPSIGEGGGSPLDEGDGGGGGDPIPNSPAAEAQEPSASHGIKTNLSSPCGNVDLCLVPLLRRHFNDKTRELKDTLSQLLVQLANGPEKSPSPDEHSAAASTTGSRNADVSSPPGSVAGSEIHQTGISSPNSTPFASNYGKKLNRGNQEVEARLTCVEMSLLKSIQDLFEEFDTTKECVKVLQKIRAKEGRRVRSQVTAAAVAAAALAARNSTEGRGMGMMKTPTASEMNQGKTVFSKSSVGGESEEHKSRENSADSVPAGEADRSTENAFSSVDEVASEKPLGTESDDPVSPKTPKVVLPPYEKIFDKLDKDSSEDSTPIAPPKLPKHFPRPVPCAVCIVEHENTDSGRNRKNVRSGIGEGNISIQNRWFRCIGYISCFFEHEMSSEVALPLKQPGQNVSQRQHGSPTRGSPPSLPSGGNKNNTKSTTLFNGKDVYVEVVLENEEEHGYLIDSIMILASIMYRSQYLNCAMRYNSMLDRKVEDAYFNHLQMLNIHIVMPKHRYHLLHAIQQHLLLAGKAEPLGLVDPALNELRRYQRMFGMTHSKSNSLNVGSVSAASFNSNADYRGEAGSPDQGASLHTPEGSWVSNQDGTLSQNMSLGADLIAQSSVSSVRRHPRKPNRVRTDAPQDEIYREDLERTRMPKFLLYELHTGETGIEMVMDGGLFARFSKYVCELAVTEMIRGKFIRFDFGPLMKERRSLRGHVDLAEARRVLGGPLLCHTMVKWIQEGVDEAEKRQRFSPASPFNIFSSPHGPLPLSPNFLTQSAYPMNGMMSHPSMIPIGSPGSPNLGGAMVTGPTMLMMMPQQQGNAALPGQVDPLQPGGTAPAAMFSGGQPLNVGRMSPTAVTQGVPVPVPGGMYTTLIPSRQGGMVFAVPYPVTSTGGGEAKPGVFPSYPNVVPFAGSPVALSNPVAGAQTPHIASPHLNGLMGQVQQQGTNQPMQMGMMGQAQQQGNNQPMQMGMMGQAQQQGNNQPMQMGMMGQVPQQGTNQPMQMGMMGQAQQQGNNQPMQMGMMGQPQQQGNNQPMQMGMMGQAQQQGNNQPMQMGMMGQVQQQGNNQPMQMGMMGQVQQQGNNQPMQMGMIGQAQQQGNNQPMQMGMMSQAQQQGNNQPMQMGMMGQAQQQGANQPMQMGMMGQAQQQGANQPMQMGMMGQVQHQGNNQPMQMGMMGQAQQQGNNQPMQMGMMGQVQHQGNNQPMQMGMMGQAQQQGNNQPMQMGRGQMLQYPMVASPLQHGLYTTLPTEALMSAWGAGGIPSGNLQGPGTLQQHGTGNNGAATVLQKSTNSVNFSPKSTPPLSHHHSATGNMLSSQTQEVSSSVSQEGMEPSNDHHAPGSRASHDFSGSSLVQGFSAVPQPNEWGTPVPLSGTRNGEYMPMGFADPHHDVQHYQPIPSSNQFGISSEPFGNGVALRGLPNNNYPAKESQHSVVEEGFTDPAHWTEEVVTGGESEAALNHMFNPDPTLLRTEDSNDDEAVTHLNAYNFLDAK